MGLLGTYQGKIKKILKTQIYEKINPQCSCPQASFLNRNRFSRLQYRNLISPWVRDNLSKISDTTVIFNTSQKFQATSRQIDPALQLCQYKNFFSNFENRLFCDKRFLAKNENLSTKESRYNFFYKSKVKQRQWQKHVLLQFLHNKAINSRDGPVLLLSLLQLHDSGTKYQCHKQSERLDLPRPQST